MHKFIIFGIVFLHCLLNIVGVDKNNFKTCEQSSFCRRCRKLQPGNSVFELVPGTLNTNEDSVMAEIINKENDHLFIMKLEALVDNTFHVLIDEKTPLKQRYRVTDALRGTPKTKSIQISEKSDTEIIITADENKAVIHAKPFKIDFYHNNILTLSANAKGLMRFEHLRHKPDPRQETDDEGVPIENVKPKSIEDDDPGAWEENYKSHHDSKPNGPEAIAMDFSFPQANILFGIPEHADTFALRSTINSEPYRLYNLDVFEYELDNGMALYGSVPVIYGHGPSQTVGVYWQNPSETWVDIYNPDAEKNVLSSLVNMVSGSNQKDPFAANFMSESGVLDAYILMGPKPNDVFKQYTDLTGVVPLPQMFTLGYHQCRWNYNDEIDVDTVNNNFDKYDIPMDTMWLDIEYTDSKKYFTWDKHKFGHSLDMIYNLTAKGRHLVIIIDPHIKRDGNYFFHNDCTDRGYYTKNKDSKDYEGWCWPGAASYPDVFNPVVRKYFADQYLLENFKGTSEDVMIWNDMNEPSVFNGPEVTMLKDNLHFGDWEHRHVHNLYGHMQLLSTFDGLMRRSQSQQRPFILTRGHFSGSQRLAAIWTGDNMADWNHLAASIKMCLTESVAGFSFCGADIGGFFGNPDAELIERWYQTAVFQPFVRSHSHIDTKRREPWLFPDATTQIIREALRKRYSYLPLWYTMFYEHERFGLPIMRPMLSQYPQDINGYNIDNQYLLADKLLVHPVTQQGVSHVNVYFPSIGSGPSSGTAQTGSDLWYDIDDYRKIDRVGHESITVDRNKIPVYQRGGTIIPKKERIRRAATLMIHDPYTLVVCLNREQYAHGTLFIDDERSYEYRNGKYAYLEFEFTKSTLTGKQIDDGEYLTESWLERVIVVGLSSNKQPKSATLSIASNAGEITLSVEQIGGNAIVIRKPGISILENFTITLNY